MSQRAGSSGDRHQGISQLHGALLAAASPWPRAKCSGARLTARACLPRALPSTGVTVPGDMRGLLFRVSKSFLHPC